MTTELRTHLARLDLTQAGLAHALGLDPRTVERPAAGSREIPEPILRLLQRVRRGF